MISKTESNELTDRISHSLTEYFYAIDDLSGEYGMIDDSNGHGLEHALFDTLGDEKKIRKILEDCAKAVA